MKQAIQKFMKNDDFHNPLTDRKKSLLSTKEKWKGIILPLAGMAGILGAVGAVSLGLGIFPSFVQSVAVIAVAAVPARDIGLRAITYLKSKFSTAYDFDKAEDIEAFKKAYPSHPNLPDNMITLAKEAGLKQTPELSVCHSKRTGAFSYQKSLFDKKKGISLSEDDEMIMDEGSVLGILGHEMAHLKHGDLGSKSFLKMQAPYAAGLGMSFGVGLDLMTSGALSIIKGAAFMVAGIAGTEIFYKKMSQYKERRTDRSGILLSGNADTLGGRFLLCSIESGEIMYGKNLKQKFSDATERLRSSHPKSYDRGTYLHHFAEANKEFCEQQAAKYKVTPVQSPFMGQ